MKLPTAFVTGCNSGVGLSLATKLAANHKVFAGVRGLTDAKRADLDRAAAAAGVTDNLEVIECDVASEASVQEAVAAMLAKTDGRCDLLVANAGFSLFGSVEMLPMDDIRSQFETNVFGAIRCQQAVLPAMRQQGAGKIVLLSSVGGVWGQPFNDAYCASKFALEGLAESQAALFRGFGVRVCCVQPGAIRTAFIANAKRPDMAKVPAEYHAPLQRTMAAYQRSGQAAPDTSQTPDEVAQIIIDRVVAVAEPPLKVQTNPAIAAVFEGQLKDTTGEWGVQAAAKRFLAEPAQELSKHDQPMGQAPSHIEVSDFVQTSAGHLEYTIRSHTLGGVVVATHRYSDFARLQTVLASAKINYDNPFPGKLLVHTEARRKERMATLETWLNGALGVPAARDDPAFHAFLGPPAAPSA